MDGTLAPILAGNRYASTEFDDFEDSEEFQQLAKELDAEYEEYINFEPVLVPQTTTLLIPYIGSIPTQVHAALKKVFNIRSSCQIFTPDRGSDESLMDGNRSPIYTVPQFVFNMAGVSYWGSYDNVYSILALCFARPNHEKVILLDVITSRGRTIYSSIRPGETIVNKCFHEDGNRLLITTQYECYECDLESGKLATVTKAGPNERLAAGNCRGEEVKVAVVEHSGQKEPSLKLHCILPARRGWGISPLLVLPDARTG